MKKTLILAGTIVALALSSQAAVVFDENFDGQSFVPENLAVVLGGATPGVVAGQWFGATNAVAMDNELQLEAFTSPRARGAGIWLDSSAWTLGTVTVEFDILDYVAGSVDADPFFQAYAATGVDGTNSVGIDVMGAAGDDPVLSSTGTATIGTIGARNTIVGNATQAAFTFDFTGQANIALVFFNTASTLNMAEYSIDNLTVTTVPEPGTYALLAGLTGLVFVMVRRRA